MKQIPGLTTPRGLQMLQWTVDPIGFMETSAQRYGDIFQTFVGSDPRPLVYVSHPEALKQILGNESKDFTIPGKSNEILSPILGTSAVFMLDGESHRRRRKLLMPPFHGERLRNYAQLICDLTQQVIEQQPVGQVFVARTLMQEISLKVILDVVFGLYAGERSEKIADLIRSLLDFFKSPLTFGFLLLPWLQKDLGPLSPWGNFSRLLEQIDQLLYEEIEARRQQENSERTDILSLMLSVQDEEGRALTNQQLRDELLTLLFAGHETTATAMAWALYWLHYLPEVGTKLRQELASLGSNPEAMAIYRLPYLNAVCSETLRIHPVGMLTFVRGMQTPVEVMGYQFTPQMNVVGCIYLTHQREDLYPQPKQFKPERFLERQFSPYEFFPFGGGVRRCLGEALAQLEIRLVVATIMSHYQLELADSKPEFPQRRGVTLAPAGGVKIRVMERYQQPLGSNSRE